MSLYIYKDHVFKIMSLYIYKDLRLKDFRSNESRDHYHKGRNVVPSPRCGFCWEAAFQLWGLKLTLSVYIRNATLRYDLSLASLFLCRIVQSWKKIYMDNCEKRRCPWHHNQFKRPSAGSVRELYYIYSKTFLVPSPRHGFRFEAVSQH